jgi:hypothetical protein
MTVTLRHFLIVSHAVPADRVRSLVPAGLTLDTIKVQGETCAILQATCFFNDNFHYTPLPKPSLDFWQTTYRVLTRQPAQKAAAQSGPAVPGPATASPATARPDPGAFFFQTYLGTRASWGAQRAVASEADYADFNVIMRGEYATYVADVKPTDDTPPMQIAVRARARRDQRPVAPFVDWDKMTYFLTYRPNAYYQLSVGENLGVLTVEHEVMHPIAAEIAPVGAEIPEVRFGVWEKLGLLTAAEMPRPFAVLIQPEIKFVTQAPRAAKLEG